MNIILFSPFYRRRCRNDSSIREENESRLVTKVLELARAKRHAGEEVVEHEKRVERELRCGCIREAFYSRDCTWQTLLLIPQRIAGREGRGLIRSAVPSAVAVADSASTLSILPLEFSVLLGKALGSIRGMGGKRRGETSWFSTRTPLRNTNIYPSTGFVRLRRGNNRVGGWREDIGGKRGLVSIIRRHGKRSFFFRVNSRSVYIRHLFFCHRHDSAVATPEQTSGRFLSRILFLLVLFQVLL